MDKATTDKPAMDATYDFMAASPYAHIAYALDMTVIDLNWRHTRLTGVSRGAAIGRKLYDVFPPNPNASQTDARPAIAASIDRMVATREPDEMEVVQHDLLLSQGGFERRYWQLTHSPIFAGPEGTGEIVGALQTTRDVTVETLRLRVQAAQHRAAVVSGELMFFELDLDTFEMMSTDGFEALHGQLSGQNGNSMTAYLDRVHPEDRSTAVAVFEGLRNAADDTEEQFEYRLVLPDETTRWLTARVEIIRGAEGVSPKLTGMVVDVTDLRLSERAQCEAIQARDVLLAEVNHRVKNSLQLVTSVLNMEARAAKGTDAFERLHNAAARVQAIATVHGALYESSDAREVDLGAFLGTLVDHIAISSAADARGIAVAVVLDKDDQPIHLSTDRAISLSLVVNEIVTNAFKHAFPDERRGQIDVHLARLGEGGISVTIADDGVGYSGTTGVLQGLGTTSSGLGSSLIAALAKQIGAHIRHVEGPGHIISLEFDA